jgi:hypothetical protein
MVSPGMLRRVALVRTDVSEELSASVIRVTRIGELGTPLVTASVVPSSPILVTLMTEALSSSEMSVLTRGTRRNIPEDSILPLNVYPRLFSLLHKSVGRFFVGPDVIRGHYFPLSHFVPVPYCVYGTSGTSSFKMANLSYRNAFSLTRSGMSIGEKI